MSQKFDDVPVEKDTRILFRHPVTFGKYDALYEMLSWEGIQAESVIFATDDISDMTDEEPEQEVRQSPLVKKNSAVTIKRSVAEYAFVNFNSDQD